MVPAWSSTPTRDAKPIFRTLVNWLPNLFLMTVQGFPMNPSRLMPQIVHHQGCSSEDELLAFAVMKNLCHLPRFVLF